jgi:hypothetical protein
MFQANTQQVRVEIAEPGWRAVYREGDTFTSRRIAAWALMRSPDSMTTVRLGVVIDGDRISDANHVEAGQLCGYAPPGVPISDFLEPQEQLGHQVMHLSPSLTRPASSWFG